MHNKVKIEYLCKFFNFLLLNIKKNEKWFFFYLVCVFIIKKYQEVLSKKLLL